MDAWITLVAAVVGAVLGISGTLGTQLLGNRASRLQARRAELKETLKDFIRATQVAEETAAHHQDDSSLKGRAATDMWVAQKLLRLLVDDNLGELADEYCNALGACLWKPTEEEPWRRVREPQQVFLRAATDALAAVQPS
jgi:hypothetical protein